MTGTWVVVADSSRARIFEARRVQGALHEVESLVHPESRLREVELSSDQPGRRFATAGPKRHGMTQPVSMKEEHAIKFAKKLADHLEAERARGHFDRLFLAAAPRFLGLLRENFTPLTAAAISQDYNKDWTLQTPAEIRTHLPEHL